MIHLAPKWGLIDRPDERRIHEGEVPRAGGLAVWATFLVVAALVVAVFPGSGALGWGWYRAFVIASALLLVVGVIDDRWGMPAWWKLAAQVSVAVLLFFAKGSGVGSFLGHQIPWGLDLLFWVVWTVGVINAFNLIDGMDGLCAGLASISTTVLAVMSFFFGRSLDGLVMLAMVGALLGFLRFNFHPARIFLGDAGSMFIGLFVASAATVSAGERAVVVSLLIPVLVAGVPLFDVLLAVWRRTARRWLSELGVGRAARVFGADREHLHHRLLDAGFNQRKVAVLLYAIAGVGALVVLLPYVFDERAVGITVAALMIAALVGFRYFAPVELQTSGAVLHLALKRPPAGRLIALFYFCYDAGVILLVLGLAFTIEDSGKTTWIQREEIVPFAAITLACGVVGLRLAKAHSRHWARASIRDFWALALWYGVALQVAFTITTLANQDLAWRSARIFIMTGAISLVLMMLPRSITPVLREAMIDSHHRRRGRAKGRRKRVVLYGAGDLGELFLSHLKTSSPMELHKLRILGFIDDHPNLKRRVLDGFRIYGTVQDLPALIDRHNLHGVVITATRLKPERADELNRIVEETGLTLYWWRPHLQLTKIGPREILEVAQEA